MSNVARRAVSSNSFSLVALWSTRIATWFFPLLTRPPSTACSYWFHVLYVNQEDPHPRLRQTKICVFDKTADEPSATWATWQVASIRDDIKSWYVKKGMLVLVMSQGPDNRGRKVILYMQTDDTFIGRTLKAEDTYPSSSTSSSSS